MKDFAVIFDMDGVIVDSNSYHKEAYKLFFANHGIFVSDEDFKLRMYGRINPDIIKHFFGNIPPEQIREYVEEKENLFRKLMGKNITATKGLPEFLEMLKENGITCAVATSAPPENAEFILSGLHIKDHFDVIVDETQVTKGKPDPEIYLKAAEKINYPPERCIVVEDSVSGIKSGLNAGMKVVAIATTHKREELPLADMVIDDFSGLDIEKMRGLIK